jgi:transcription initiation factor IIE alpha subunit
MSLCWKCKDYLKEKYGRNFYQAPSNHCHHDEPEEKPKKEFGCGVCGDGLVYIRGRYPHEDRRLVCATCLQERFERIHDETSPDYGKAGQLKSKLK